MDWLQFAPNRRLSSLYFLIGSVLGVAFVAGIKALDLGPALISGVVILGGIGWVIGWFQQTRR